MITRIFNLRKIIKIHYLNTLLNYPFRLKILFAGQYIDTCLKSKNEKFKTSQKIYEQKSVSFNFNHRNKG